MPRHCSQLCWAINRSSRVSVRPRTGMHVSLHCHPMFAGEEQRVARPALQRRAGKRILHRPLQHLLRGETPAARRPAPPLTPHPNSMACCPNRRLQHVPHPVVPEMSGSRQSTSGTLSIESITRPKLNMSCLGQHLTACCQVLPESLAMLGARWLRCTCPPGQRSSAPRHSVASPSAAQDTNPASVSSGGGATSECSAAESAPAATAAGASAVAAASASCGPGLRFKVSLRSRLCRDYASMHACSTISHQCTHPSAISQPMPCRKASSSTIARGCIFR